MDGLISLGPYYNRNIRQVRDAVQKSRVAGLKTMKIYLTAPITCPVIEVAVTTASVWVVGFKALSASNWWEFEPSGDLPPLPGPSILINGPPANYGPLGLNKFIAEGSGVHVVEPWRLLQDLSVFNGHIDTDEKAKHIILMIFLVSEAVRFNSMQSLCFRYVDHTERYFQAPDFYYRNPEALKGHTFDFRWSISRDGRMMTVKEIVDSWRKSSEAGSQDVVLLPG